MFPKLGTHKEHTQLNVARECGLKMVRSDPGSHLKGINIGISVKSRLLWGIIIKKVLTVGIFWGVSENLTQLSHVCKKKKSERIFGEHSLLEKDPGNCNFSEIVLKE